MADELTIQKTEMLLSATHGVSNYLDPEQFTHMARVANMFSKSSIVPQSYQGKPEDCLIALDMASRIGTNPLMVMQNLYVVKGKPSWSGQACATLIKNCGRFSSVKHIRTGEIGTMNRGCYYTAIDNQSGETLTGVEVTVQMAKDEGWLGKDGSKWKTMPEVMLVYRAAAFFAREHCPDVLMGVQTDYEVEDIYSKPRNKAEDLTQSIMSEVEQKAAQ